MRDPAIHRFRQVVGVALRHLEARQEEINDLNVFPVADGDTGDNMVLTMRYVLEELDRLDESGNGDPPRSEIVRAVARAALMGARGNSGVILSQIVRGAANALATPPGRLIDPEATDAEQNALLAEMLAAALFSGEEALRHTPEQLAVLRERGAKVDAGALGLVVIVRGLMSGLAGEQVELPEIPRYEPARITDVHHADSRYRWCTNFIVIGTGLAAESFASRLEELGDSVLVVGDEETLKVHVHTDDFEAAKAVFAGAGQIEREDIADMHVQVAEQRARLAGGRSGAVVVASGGGVRSLYEGLGAVVVDGGQSMNPATNDLVRAIEACPAAEVVVLPNSPNVILAAREAAEVADKAVEVVESESQQAGVAALVELDPVLDAAANAARL